MDSPTPSTKQADTKDVNDPDSVSTQKQSIETALPTELISAGSQNLHRKLGGKEIQLFAVGGAIGTCMPDCPNYTVYVVWVILIWSSPALYVQMGASLPKGGPAGLFLGFVAYGTIVLAVNQCFGEFSCIRRASCQQI